VEIAYTAVKLHVLKNNPHLCSLHACQWYEVFRI